MKPMYLGIFDPLIDDFWNGVREVLQGWVLSNLQSILETINERTASVSGELVKTPDTWNSDIWTLVLKIAQQVALPVAGTVFTFVIVWELITMLTSPKMGDVDVVEVIMRWLLKAVVASFFISNSVNICAAFFGISSDMVTGTKGILDTQLSATTNNAFDSVQDFFSDYMYSDEDATGKECGELLRLGLETSILGLIMKIMGILITIIMYSRMISIYLHLSVAPIPVAAITNQKFQDMGINYFKNVFALAMQGVLMMICVAIYGALISSLFNDPASTLNLANVTLDASDHEAVLKALSSAVFESVALSVMLVYVMFGSERVTKTIFSVQ